MRLLAPAKINLHLRVFGVQSDGFHPLLSWMTTVGLFDTLEIEPAPTGIALTCDDPSIPCDSRNLVYRAAHLMLSSFAPTVTALPWDGLKIHLGKQIPHGGGLGGGSSDAARTLLGLNQLMQLNRSIDQLAEFASELGSDVPFFLHGPSSICQGRGEIVTPIGAPKPRWATLIFPEITMPTPQVYKVFDLLGLGKAQAGIREAHERGEGMDQSMPRHHERNGGGAAGQECTSMQEWTSLRADELLPRLINDLETPAFTIAPHLGRLRSELEQKLGRIVRMSGSGSTLFTLFDKRSDAENASTIIERLGTRAIATEIGVSPGDDLSAT